jgi:hypothetical protein
MKTIVPQALLNRLASPRCAKICRYVFYAADLYDFGISMETLATSISLVDDTAAMVNWLR